MPAGKPKFLLLSMHTCSGDMSMVVVWILHLVLSKSMGKEVKKEVHISNCSHGKGFKAIPFIANMMATVSLHMFLNADTLPQAQINLNWPSPWA
ncbi:hypothetical protein DACRYDRAFT_105905 [Dacryopinax primogenitus]|uniref:Uncharacterized protein n=1 Tax=Dacryopinax primogenitus (strain DJM 731) TaxID=1858805 RepID=M5GF16_DACPD|nr:uncharacterized protein DACRYDRAFT_105905 [Dacryopinax primogenitus]EJU03748.1 hypothetical protein DACRYDRAFT_105905 [Dacryopinax primogenitus]